MIPERKVYILGIATVFGALIAIQSRSFESVSELLLRDSESNIFQEIKILKEKNTDLRREIDELEASTGQLDNQNSALEAIQFEIEKYEKLSGDRSIFGPGVSITLRGDITTPWITDFVNEVFNAGAQAVSVNGIRITNTTIGFDTLPKGQILLNGSILSTPYEFTLIGESSALESILSLPGGIFERLKLAFPGLKIAVERKEIIQMT